MKQWQIFLMLGFFLIVLSSFDNAEAAPSPIAISADKYSGDLMEGDYVVFTLTLDSVDLRYKTQDIYLSAVWPSGIAWESYFFDVNGDELQGNLLQLSRTNSTTILFAIFCEGECSTGDTNVVQIYGQTDPKFYNYDGNVTDNCGSDDCENDSTPASYSSNVTNTITVTLSAWAEYHSEVTCDVVSNTGDNKVYPSNTTLWYYNLTNVGWNTDDYLFVSTLTSADNQNVDYWTIAPGMADGKELVGQGNTSSAAVHTAEGAISIIPATNATPGIYNVELAVTSTNGAQTAGCNFDVIVPGSETEEETTGDPANETAEKETEEVIETLPEEEIEELPEEVSAISLIPVLISIGLIAVSRRK